MKQSLSKVPCVRLAKVLTCQWCMGQNYKTNRLQINYCSPKGDISVENSSVKCHTTKLPPRSSVIAISQPGSYPCMQWSAGIHS